MYRENGFKYNKIQILPDVFRRTAGIMLHGYFQSYKYFEKETNQIIESFTFINKVLTIKNLHKL